MAIVIFMFMGVMAVNFVPWAPPSFKLKIFWQKYSGVRVSHIDLRDR